MPDAVIDTTARPVDADGEPVEDPREDPAPPAPTTPSPGTDIERHIDRGNQVVEHAADAALAMPGVAGRDEFLSLAMQARMLSLSGAAPEAIRDNPYVAFHVAMVGRDLGISPSAAIELIDVIPGKSGPQLSLSPQLMNAQVHRMYGGEIVPSHWTVDRCVAVAVGPGGRDRRCRIRWPEHVDDCSCDIIGSSEFTWSDARMAELVGPDCQPGHHEKTQTRSRGDRSWKVCGCNQGYITYPKRMMWQRACGFAADDYFPGAGLGLYTPEALGAVVDEDGRPIDPANVELPDGYVDSKAEQRQQRAERQSRAEQPGDPAELWQLQLRVYALPDAAKEKLAETKAKTDRLAGLRFCDLPRAAVNVAKALVAGIESGAARDGYDKHAAPRALEAEIVAKLVSVLATTFGGDGTPLDSTGSAPDSTPPGSEAPPEGGDTPESVQGHTEPVSEGPEIDIAAIRAEAEESVAAMSVKAVRAELAAMEGVPTTGTGAELRARLVAIETEREIGAQRAGAGQ